MKWLDRYLNTILVVLVLIVAGGIFIHVIHAYERLSVQRPEVTVTIPEGSTMYDIDRILSANGVLAQGAFVAAARSYGVPSGSPTTSLEGMLFPDTYDFYVGSTASSVIQKFLTNFNAKAEPLFAADLEDSTSTQSVEDDLIIASMVQKEVASSTDMAIVAGILEKRFAAGDYLNVDATICYAKQMVATSSSGCYPITATDLKIDSPYNTYLHKGLPPTPIGNPGVEAIEATLHPESSTYWYYLSDPKTGATIYAATLAEQNANIAKYFGE